MGEGGTFGLDSAAARSRACWPTNEIHFDLAIIHGEQENEAPWVYDGQQMDVESPTDVRSGSQLDQPACSLTVFLT